MPLQIHPNIELASKLHQKEPDKFQDPNHKPEIAVALSKFEAFAGFKPFHEIQALLELEPLRKFLPQTNLNNESLRGVCRNLLEASEDLTVEVQEALQKTPREKFGTQGYILGLLPRLQRQYTKADSGSLVALICMNYLVLQPGDALYIPADGLHAYLSGDIVECMARSDNVINAGFCPRADRDDIELFTSTLTFSSHRAEEMSLPSKLSDRSKDGKTKVYAPPLSEFNMLVTTLGKGEKETVGIFAGPSIMIVTSGSGSMAAGSQQVVLQTGYIFFVGQGVEVKFETDGDLEVYRAYAE